MPACSMSPVPKFTMGIYKRVYEVAVVPFLPVIIYKRLLT